MINLNKPMGKELLELVKEIGIIGKQNGSKERDYTRIGDALSRAERSIDILAYYGDELLNSQRAILINKINDDGVNVRLLNAVNSTDFLLKTADLEGEINLVNFVTNRIQTAENNIERIIADTCINPKGSFRSRSINTEIRYALVIVDDEWAWWTPYHTGIRTEDSTSFELINNDEKSFINLCIEHFKILWEKYGQN